MIKIDRTCSNSFLGYTIISICLLEGDKKQLGVFFISLPVQHPLQLITMSTTLVNHSKCQKLIILYKNKKNKS